MLLSLNMLGLLSFFPDPAIIQQVDGLGRNATMHCVHGNTPVHTECLEMLIDANCDLDHQANGRKIWKFHSWLGTTLPTLLSEDFIQIPLTKAISSTWQLVMWPVTAEMTGK